jgi:ADP-ribose pyrophosphatase YjhB (NUDIX family)
MIKEMERDEIYRGVFLHNNLEELLHAFKTELHPVIAAGGLVFDHNQVLLIFRRGKWDLPKGKLDEGEHIEACAVREVEEETGLKGVQLIDRLMITYHTYHEKNKHVLKESHWFTMKADSRQPLQPQLEEDIAECKWVETGHLEPYFSRMHGSVQDVLEKGVNSV